jgi:hypothetical protein
LGFLKSDGKFIYLDTNYAEFYIPMYYFQESDFAEDLGDTIKTLGIFKIKINNEFHIFNAPSMIELFVIDSIESTLKIQGDTEETQYKILKYQKGQKIMNSYMIEDSSNAESFMNLILKGKIPNLIKYSDSIKIWRKNQELNSVNLGIPSTKEELIMSVAYRYNKNPEMKFSHAINDIPGITEYDYQMNNIRQICQYTSTFSSLVFEDIDSMITTSLNRTKNHGNEAFSPVEMLFKL